MDFTSKDTALLLNPRLPRERVTEVEGWLSESVAPEGLIWMLTSGSTGAPKLVGLSRDAMLDSAAAVNRHLECTESDRWLLALPLFHVGGLAIRARAHLSGTEVVAPFAEKKWSPSRFLETTARHRATLSALVPTQVYDLVSTNVPCPESIRAIVVGGGALKPELFASARRLGYPLLPSYGLTECGSQIATAPLHTLTQSTFPNGVCLDHVMVSISGHCRIRIKSDALLTGYLYPTEGGVVFEDPKERGWFETDDRGELIGSELVVYGRASRIVKISGENVDLDKLQAHLQSLLTSNEWGFGAALTTIPDERLGRVVVLVVEADGRKRAHSLRHEFNRTVMPFERIQKLALTREITTSELGKRRPIQIQDIEFF